MHQQPEPVILLIADISGYTQFMTANAKSLAHSQAIITELVMAIIRQVDLPLAVAKLEGDAVFLYGKKEGGGRPWSDTKKLIGERMLRFFEAFEAKLDEFRLTSTCGCHACTNVSRLKLKLVVHSGEALFHHVFGMLELAGVDVIIAHRLLKNSVTGDQYILVTEAATDDVEFPVVVPFSRGVEKIDDIGQVKTLVFLPKLQRARAVTLFPAAPPVSPAPQSFKAVWSRATRWWLRLWFLPLAGIVNPHRKPYRNLSLTQNIPARWGFALVCLVLTPIFVPVGLIFVLVRMWARHLKTGFEPSVQHIRA